MASVRRSRREPEVTRLARHREDLSDMRPNHPPYTFILIFLSQLAISDALVPRKSRISPKRPTFYAARQTTIRALEPSDEEAHQEDALTDETQIQREIESMVNQPCTTNLDVGEKRFDPERMDANMLPIPMFTGIVVLFFSLYVTGYMFYVGINGFSVDNPLPGVF